MQLTLKTPRFDGTSHLILTADELIERLVAIIPRPHKNLILDTGVLAPNSKLRARVTSFGRDASSAPARVPTTSHAHAEHPGQATTERTSQPHRDNSEWARLMRRAFDLDVLCCPKCNGRMHVLALIERPRIACRILRHLGMHDHPPPIAPARMPETGFDDVA